MRYTLLAPPLVGYADDGGVMFLWGIACPLAAPLRYAASLPRIAWRRTTSLARSRAEPCFSLRRAKHDVRRRRCRGGSSRSDEGVRSTEHSSHLAGVFKCAGCSEHGSQAASDDGGPWRAI